MGQVPRAAAGEGSMVVPELWRSSSRVLGIHLHQGDAALVTIPFLVSQTCPGFAMSKDVLTFICLHTRMRNYLLHYFIYQHFPKLQGSSLHIFLWKL